MTGCRITAHAGCSPALSTRAHLGPRHARRHRGLRRAQEVAARHPRHVLLAAIAAGLLFGPRWPQALAAAAVVVLLVAREP